MSSDGRAIANYVLDLCESKGRKVSPLSLQKIVYFCHVWTLIKLNRPLIKHSFEAWEFGPVLPYLYREFKCFSDQAITARALVMNPGTGEKIVAQADLDPDVEDLVGTVIDFYSQLRAADLVSMSHVKDGPWDRVWRHQGNANPGMKIDDESIKDFYSSASIAYSSSYGSRQ